MVDMHAVGYAWHVVSGGGRWHACMWTMVGACDDILIRGSGAKQRAKNMREVPELPAHTPSSVLCVPWLLVPTPCTTGQPCPGARHG